MLCSLREVYLLQRNPLPYIIYPDGIYTHLSKCRASPFSGMSPPPHQKKNLNCILNGKLQEIKLETLTTPTVFMKGQNLPKNV